MKILITGVSGFIGFNVCRQLLQENNYVIGVDNLNNYYDVNLKYARLNTLREFSNFTFIQLDIIDKQAINTLFQKENFERVIHLAAQAGIRYSLDAPYSYAESNLIGYLNILEGCRHSQVKHLVYASSSSVYGLNNKAPFSTSDSVDHPISFYAATKKSNELMAHVYSHLYGIPTTGLRFFTVYGPWGRPDMAPFIFTKKILNGEPININNNGNMWRDFTYIDDIVEGILRIANIIPTHNAQWSVEHGTPASSSAPYQIYNIGHGSPINLMDFIQTIESELGIEAKKNFLPMQPGDVYQTFADTTDLFSAIGYKPKVGITEGVAKFIVWYKKFYNK